MISLIEKDLKIMDASLEVKPATTLYGMTRCALAKRYSPKEEVIKCIEWVNESMFFLDCIGTVSVDRLIQAMEYARKRHGIDVFVIDSLFKCGLSGEDYAGARSFVDRLTSFCNNTGAHVILVAHSRKTSQGNELTPPSKSDVAGSSDITNAAFNVIVVWRNKLKRRKMDEAKASGNIQMMAEWESQPDGKIILDKQRFGDGEECEVPTWFCKDSCQFHTMQGRNIPYFQVK
jgi:twinkle protein